MKTKPKPSNTVYQLLFDYPLTKEDEIVLFPMKQYRKEFNCFKTRREAEVARRKIIEVLKGEKKP